MNHDFSFIDHLQRVTRAAPQARKGLRTREQLKIAAARMLEEQGYHGLRLRDVTAAAGLAEGTIYVHFADRAGVIREVMQSFLGEFLSTHLELCMQGEHDGPSTFGWVTAAKLHWLKLYRANPGLFRCMLQMSDDDPSFAALVQTFGLRWAERIADRVQQDRGVEGRNVLILLSYLMMFMLSEAARKLVIAPDAEFLGVLRRLRGSDELLASTMSLVWVRILYPEVPIPQERPGPLSELIAWFAPSDQPAPARPRRRTTSTARERAP